MKHFMASVALVAVVAMTAFVGSQSASAAGSYRGGGGKAYNGIEGTVGSLGGNGFTMSSTMGGKEGTPYNWNVKCDANTKFMAGGQQVKPSTLKAGDHVAVQGGQSGHDLMATVVTIGEAHKGKGK